MKFMKKQLAYLVLSLLITSSLPAPRYIQTDEIARYVARSNARITMLTNRNERLDINQAPALLQPRPLILTLPEPQENPITQDLLNRRAALLQTINAPAPADTDVLAIASNLSERSIAYREYQILTSHLLTMMEFSSM